MPDGVVTSFVGVGVEEKLRIRVVAFLPEEFAIGVGWELKEYFGVGAHLHAVDAGPLPGGKRGVERHDVVLEDSKGTILKSVGCVSELRYKSGNGSNISGMTSTRDHVELKTPYETYNVTIAWKLRCMCPKQY